MKEEFTFVHGFSRKSISFTVLPKRYTAFTSNLMLQRKTRKSFNALSIMLFHYLMEN